MTKSAQDSAPGAAPSGPLSAKGFKPLLISGVVDDLGTGVASIGVTLLALDLSGSPVFAGVVGAVGMIVPALWALPAGWLSDAAPRRAVMVLSQVLSATAYFALFGLLIFGRLDMLTLLVLDVIAALGALTYRACSRAIVRDIVSSDQVAQAVSFMQVRSAIAMMLGPAIGGLLYAYSPTIPLVVNAGTYATAILFMLWIRPQHTRRERTRFSFVEVTAGVRMLFGDGVLLRVSMVQMLVNGVITGFVLGLTVAIRSEGHGAFAASLVQASFGGGLIVGSVVLPNLARRLRPFVSLTIGLTVIIVSVGASSFVPWWGSLVFVVLTSCVVGPMIGIVAHIQVSRIPESLRGRTLAADDALSDVVGSLGPLSAGGLVASPYGRMALSTLGIVVLFAWSLMASNSQIRKMVTPGELSKS